MRGRHLEEVERRFLRVGRVRLDLRADQHLASIGLRDVDVQRGRDEDHVEERLQRLRHERLERMRDDRVSTPAIRQTSLVQPATAEITVPAAMSPRFVRTPVHATVADVDPRHLRPLVDVDAHPVGHPRVRPDHRVVADHASRRVVERGHDREVRMVGQVQLRAELGDLVRVDHAGVDAEQPVHLRALVRDDHGAFGVREREVPLLREQEVVVELLRELLVQAERLLVEGDPFRCPVVRADDRGVAAGSRRRRCSSCRGPRRHGCRASRARTRSRDRARPRRRSRRRRSP